MSDAAPLDSNSNQLEANDIGATTVGESMNIPFSAGECFCIEVFSGSAGLTAEMRLIFPTSFGINHKVTRPKSKVISLDLQNERNQQLLFEWSSVDPLRGAMRHGKSCQRNQDGKRSPWSFAYAVRFVA